MKGVTRLRNSTAKFKTSFSKLSFPFMKCQVRELKPGNHQTTHSPLKSQYVCPSLVQFDFMNDKMFCATSLTTWWQRKRTSLLHENPSPDINLAAPTIQSQSLTQGCLSSVYCTHGMRREQVYGVFDICVWSHCRHNTVRLLLKGRPGPGSSKDG